MKKPTINDYCTIIEEWIKYAKSKTDSIKSEAIWIIKNKNIWQLYEVNHWLFWNWILLIKKQNRTLYKAFIEYCWNKIFCKYSDYHKVYYISLDKYTKYDRLYEFYSSFKNFFIWAIY